MTENGKVGIFEKSPSSTINLLNKYID